MTILEALQESGLPVAYGTFHNKQPLPFVVYLGAGQDQKLADNTVYFSENTYQVEYYFSRKNETEEAALETALTGSGYLYSKSADVYIQSDDMYVIYYNVYKGAMTDV